LATTTANVAISSTYTITAPSPNAGAYSATPAMRACAANACATTGTFTTVTMADDSALPAWITHSAGVLTILAPDGSVKASNPWTIKIVYTPTEGSNTPTYDAVAITIDCEITSFTTSNTPANQAYTIWDALKVVNLSGVTYTQVPACGYAFTSTYVFTTTGSVSYINAGTAIVPSVEVYSLAGSDASTQTVTMAATITVGGSQGQSTLSLSGNSDVPDVTFDVVLTNPCITASIDNISFATSPLSVVDGSTGTSTFTIPQDDVDKSNTVQDLCGTKEYVVKDSSSNVINTWASIALSTTTARTYILTIDTTQYPTHVTSDTTEVLTITTTACDCSKLGWTIPALVTSSV
jgi:hypothetical protein